MPMTAEQACLRATVAGMAMTRSDADPELATARALLADANRRARARRSIDRALASLTPAERHRLLADLTARNRVPEPEVRPWRPGSGAPGHGGHL